MKQAKQLFAFSLLLLCQALFGNGCTPASTFIPRSQSRDKVRQLVGVTEHVHIADPDCRYYNFSVMPEYTRSFRPQRIAQCLFGPCVGCDDKCSSIRIQGSAVQNRIATSWLADYFYLPTDFDSTIFFKPRISNFLVDFDFFVGLNDCVDGLYFRVYGPVVHTRWDLNFCESLNRTATINHPQGYFTPNEIPVNQLLPCFGAYAQGNTPGIVNDITVTPIFPDVVFNPLRFDRIDGCDHRKTGFADLRFELGWDFIRCEDYHVGINVQAAAPTGTKLDGCLLFEPLIGNGHHWELGGGLTAHYLFWCGCDETTHAGFYLDINATHLFSTHQRRTFDLCGKPNSRYMLAERLGRPVSHNLSGATLSVASAPVGPTTALFQFKNEFAPVANLTTLDVKVSVGAQADIVAMFNWTWCNWSWDLGYNFWGKSCEKIECFACDPNPNCNPESLCIEKNTRTWALKGDAHVFGFEPVSAVADRQAIPLSATASNATICSGVGAGVTNANIDNALFAYGTRSPAGTGTLFRLLNVPDGTATDTINTSIQPIFLTCDDILFERTRGISHKVFTHFSYNFWDRECWDPYIGVGGFAEFGQHKTRCCSLNTTTSTNTNFLSNVCSTNNCQTICNPCTTTSCDPCDKRCNTCALSQWGVWLKAGASF